MTIKAEIEKLLNEFINEFEKNSTDILKTVKIQFLKKTSIVKPNQKVTRFEKPKEGYHSIEFSFIDPESLMHYIWIGIMNFSISKKIFKVITENQLAPIGAQKYEDDIKQQPSITKNILAGLITRIYVLNGFNLVFNNANRKRAIDELLNFLFNKNVTYRLLVNLHGSIGELDSISFDKNISVKKASYDIASLFCTYYHPGDWSDDEMYEGDYYIEICREFDKFNYRLYSKVENEIVDKVHKILLLSSTGNIEIGKMLRISEAWPLITTHQINPVTSKINSYKAEFPLKYEFNQDCSDKIKANYKALADVNFDKLEGKIEASIKRLKKAKSSQHIEDRIIELALAIEYLINTKPFEVTLQMCLKSIKLYDENNKDTQLYKKINDFFVLRGDVVHGNKAISNNKSNLDKIIFMENMINVITVKLLQMNKTYSLKEINKAVDTSLYVRDSLSNILDNK